MSLHQSAPLLQIIRQHREFSEAQLPAIRQEVNRLISRQETDNYIIEAHLKILLVMLSAGVGEEIFNLLQQYYSRINHWGFITYQVLAAQLHT